MFNTSVEVNGQPQSFLIAFFGFIQNGQTYALLYFIDPKQVIKSAIAAETNKTSSRRSIYIIKQYEDKSFGVISEYYSRATAPETEPEKTFLVQRNWRFIFSIITLILNCWGKNSPLSTSPPASICNRRPA